MGISWARLCGWGAGAGAGTAMMALPETGWLKPDDAKLIFVIGGFTAVICGAGFLWSLFLPLQGTKYWRSMWKIRLEKKDWLPVRRFIPLKIAAEFAYGRVGETLIAFAANHSRLVDDPIKFTATHMIYTKMLPLYGSRPHSKKVELIEEDAKIGWNQISDDLNKLEDPEGTKTLPVYQNLQMKISDVKRYIKEQNKTGNG